MQSDKSPGNGGLIKEFYEASWNELKEIFINCVSEANEKGHLSTSQRQATIRSNEKKIKIRYSYKTGGLFFIKRRFKNNTKNSSKSVSTQEMAYVKNKTYW